THPQMADRLLAPKLDALADLAPDVLVTANVGCGLHLAAGIRRRKSAVPVMSLAQLIDSRCASPPAS
ncbi:4Fe-4S ferredoxin, partial [Ectothiorhodospira sp. B14B]|nr:4Fe-4S ferredoxin [Ectothiorhodospira lacustris]